MKRKRWYGYLALIWAFLIGNYHGYIALWTEEAKDPVKVFPYSVASLPPADQEKVNAGIRVNSPDDLKQLLEDYLS